MYFDNQGHFNNDTGFEKFITDEEVIDKIFETNNPSIKFTEKLNKSKTKTRILFLAPFDWSTKYEIINEINILEEQAFINITIKENILSLGVAEQKFWIGQFSKNCRIITNDII